MSELSADDKKMVVRNSLDSSKGTTEKGVEYWRVGIFNPSWATKRGKTSRRDP